METSKEQQRIALQKKARTLKMFAIIYASILIMMVVVATLNTLKSGISFSTFFPLFFVPIEILNIYQYKKVTKEIGELSK